MHALAFLVTSIFSFATVASTAGQVQSTTVEMFVAADSAQKGAILVPIIRHELPISGAAIAGIIKVGLVDGDADVREASLAAIVSRAAGPRLLWYGAP